MNLKVLLFYLNFIPFISNSEDTLTIDLTDTLNLINYLSNIEKNQKSNEEWFKSLTEKGVSSGEKEIYFSEEAIILLNDSIFRDKIYKDEYTGLYSVSEERFITEKEAESGDFRDIKELKEVNYFFKMSNYKFVHFSLSIYTSPTF